MDQTQFITWLASGGGAAVALAFIAERLPAFQKFSPGGKSYAILAGSLIIALAAYAYLAYVPPDVQTMLAQPFQIVYGVVGVWVTSQVAHKADPAA